MNWTAILANAGIPESPGRQEAVQHALDRAAAREQAQQAITIAARTGRGTRQNRKRP
jgi:hypothetical protein